MSSITYDFIVGDVVQITGKSSYDGSALDSRKIGNNMNWIITAVDHKLNMAVLGKYRAFGLPYAHNPAIVVHMKDLKMVQDACRHSETRVLEAIPPSCCNSGKTQGLQCALCGEILSEQLLVDPLGHQFESDYDVGKRTCMLCKVEEYIPKKNVELTKKDLESLISIIDNMLEDGNAEDKGVELTLPDASFSYVNSSYGHATAEYISKDLNGFFRKATSDTTHKLPLIVWFHDTAAVGMTKDQFNKDTISKSIVSGKSGFKAHLFAPQLPQGSWIDYKTQFFNTVEYIINTYSIDTRKIVLMGAGLGGSAVQFFAYQRPEYFSAFVVIDGHTAYVDLDSLSDRSGDFYLYSTGTVSHMNQLSDRLNDAVEVVDSVNTAVTYAFSNVGTLLSKNAPSSEEPECPFEVMVLSNKVLLKSDSTTDSEPVENQAALRGHKLKIVKTQESQNYLWGRLDSSIWEPLETEGNVTSSATCWIPLENTNYFNKEIIDDSEMIVPCCYNSFGKTFAIYHSNGVEYQHTGIDLQAPRGTPVYAVASGYVSEISSTLLDGNKLIIEHDDGMTSIYSHINSISEFFVGKRVNLGEMIGKVGDTVVEEDPHLHFEMKDSNGISVNPKDYIEFI